MLNALTLFGMKGYLFHQASFPQLTTPRTHFSLNVGFCKNGMYRTGWSESSLSTSFNKLGTLFKQSFIFETWFYISQVHY